MTRGPDKEHGTNMPTATGRIWERSKEDATHPTNLLESLLESILAEWCECHQEGPQARVIGQRQLGNESHHHKVSLLGRAGLLGSLALPFSTQAPLPSEVSLCQQPVSLQTMHFWELDKSPVSGLVKGTPSCNKKTLLGEWKEKPQTGRKYLQITYLIKGVYVEYSKLREWQSTQF